MSNHRNAIRALRAGETVELEGIEWIADEDQTNWAVGDFYIGQRNTPPRLLTVKSFSFYWYPPLLAPAEQRKSEHIVSDQPRLPERGRDTPSWINPVESAYAYDFHECVRVRPVEAEVLA